ncbi:sugar phosphate isomerase/epimerase family protein [Microtetraspora sp. NBRC 16547]|uniref:sugar phosphate isomerase/epimerase family protein n=1 Tax=Microtetraspora sp. NBRC 16547 TaxID=3030993 RepID=UPI0024A1F53C|nr:sugar phosphate isomerase/epimerase family protein [Microtetraspora sp. NBRC 16547]GLW99294.1 xylose isomerase [Microtetraspora sp. NBRC 16547]
MTTWPLAMSTLGLPGTGLAEACRIAVAAGCAGLELRAHPDTGVHVAMDARERAQAVNLLAEAGLAPLAVAGYTRIADAKPDDEVLERLRAEIVLAGDLGAPYLRVFPGGDRDEGDDKRAVRRLRAVAAQAMAAGVRLLIETHDSHPTGRDIRRLLAAVGAPEVTGAVWDALHPWRHGEKPADTLAALADHLGYVQIKDAVSAEDTTPVPLGAGGVPLPEIRRLLLDQGYDGWVSLEWERTWYPRVAPVETVLPAALAWTRGT